MVWKNEYSIDIPEIDEQHKQLFACIDRLDAAKDDRGRELAVYFVLEELNEYVKVHFKVEEIVMRLFDYPGLASHAAEHHKFMARLKSFETIELGHDVHAEASSYLREWLIKHIQGSDRHYAAFVLAQQTRDRASANSSVGHNR